MKYVSTNQDERAFFVPPGTYELTVLDAIETVSKSSGADMIKLSLEVEGHGCRLFDYLIAAESSAWKIDAFRRALGETPVEGEEAELEPEDLIGRRVRARLRTEEYNGKTSNKVDSWLAAQKPTRAPATQAAPQPEDDDEPF